MSPSRRRRSPSRTLQVALVGSAVLVGCGAGLEGLPADGEGDPVGAALCVTIDTQVAAVEQAQMVEIQVHFENASASSWRGTARVTYREALAAPARALPDSRVLADMELDLGADQGKELVLYQQRPERAGHYRVRALQALPWTCLSAEWSGSVTRSK